MDSGQSRSIAPRASVILLIEDEESIRQILTLALEFEGFQVFTAANGQEGLDLLSHMPRPSLILLDLMMPIMDGWEFMRALAERPDQATIPVAVVTAFTRRTEPVKAVAILQKPVDLNELFKLAKQYSKQAA